jgi:hypothetical protein
MELDILMQPFAVLVGRLLARRWIRDSQRAPTSNDGDVTDNSASCEPHEGTNSSERVESPNTSTSRWREPNGSPGDDH